MIRAASLRCRVRRAALTAVLGALAFAAGRSVRAQAPPDPALEARRELVLARRAYDDQLAEVQDDFESMVTDLRLALDRERQAVDPGRRKDLDRRIAKIASLYEDLRASGRWPPASAEIANPALKERWRAVQRTFVDAISAAIQRARDAGADPAALESRKKQAGLTEDIARWQPLQAAFVETPEHAGWSLAGNTYFPPIAGRGGASVPLCFRRDFPVEYALRFSIERKNEGDDLRLDLVDPSTRPFSITLHWGEHLAPTDAATPRKPGLSSLVVRVQIERIAIEVDDEERAAWARAEGGDYAGLVLGAPVAIEEVRLSATRAENGLRTSAEIKPLLRSGGKQATPPPIVAPGAVDDAPAGPAAARKGAVITTAPEPTSTYVETPIWVPKVREDATVAILAGARWLRRHADLEGGWDPAGFGAQCVEPPCEFPAGAADARGWSRAAATGIATLALVRVWNQFPGDEITYKAAYGGDIAIAIDAARVGVGWLAAHQGPDGSFARSADLSRTFDTAICALALLEACRASGAEEAWRLSAARAVDHLARAQSKGADGKSLGGWSRGARAPAAAGAAPGGADASAGEPDLATTFWCLAALRSAQDLGLPIEKRSLDAGFAFCRSLASSDAKHATSLGLRRAEEALQTIATEPAWLGGRPAYRSAIGACLRVLERSAGKDGFVADAAARSGADFARPGADAASGRDSVDLAGAHWAAAAASAWYGADNDSSAAKDNLRELARSLSKMLRAAQAHGTLCMQGAWYRTDAAGDVGGPVTATAIGMLALESALHW